MNILLSELKNKLKELDIEGLIELGAPHDEYDAEAEEIITAINVEPKLSFLENKVYEIWAQSFNLSDEDLKLRKDSLLEVLDYIKRDLIGNHESS